MFDVWDKDGADVVLFHGCPQSCTLNPVEILLEVSEDIVEVLLMLEIFLTRILSLKTCSVVLLPALKPACFSAMIFSACGFNLFSMIFSGDFLGWLMRLVVR